MQSGTRIQGVISHNSYTNPSPVSHPSTHNQNLEPSSTTDPRDHNDTKYGSTPEQSAPVLGTLFCLYIRTCIYVSIQYNYSMDNKQLS